MAEGSETKAKTKAMRLYSGPLSMFGAKAQIAALEKGIAFELVMVPFTTQHLYEPKHPDVLRVNPKRQVPVLIHGEVEIFDSTQIFEYLEYVQPEPPLWPPAPADRARARLLEHLSDEVYFPHVIRLMGLQALPHDPIAVASREGAAQFYAEVERRLGLHEHEFLAGSYSYADIAFYMAQVFGVRMGAQPDDSTPRLLAWRERVGARPAVREVVGAMVAYLVSHGRPIPVFLASLLPPAPKPT